jgi:hypothetical protein
MSPFIWSGLVDASELVAFFESGMINEVKTTNNLRAMSNWYKRNKELS